MADVAVDSALEHLGQLLLHHAHMTKDAKNEVEKLENDLRLFRAFLKFSTRERRTDLIILELVRQIGHVIYEVEDTIDAFETQAAETKSKNYFFRAFQTPVKLLTVVKEVDAVAAKVRNVFGDKGKFDFASLRVDDEGLKEIGGPPARRENIVGFDDEAEKLRFLLTRETQELDIISITGMNGLGKTTLATKIFYDPTIQYEFPTRIWVYISLGFSKRNAFLTILSQFTRLTEDMYRKTNEESAQLISDHLEKERFLIVMDDVWTIDHWNELKMCLPKWNKMGKVLITSNNEEVARYANRYRKPLKLRFLTHEESWLLLQLEVFGKPECPPELEASGKLIAKQCDGLPIALLVIGRILVMKSCSQEMYGKRRLWEEVGESVSTYLALDPQRIMEKIISLAYDELPYHLRQCFLYLGMFPVDFEIPSWKLLSMWIAEGFIQQKEGFTLEETAESYLMHLISMNLVIVEKIKPDGRVKTCRTHTLLRDFCRIETGNERENFLQEINSGGEIFEHPVSEVLQKCRRLCVQSEFLEFISSEPVGPRVRTLVYFCEEEIDLPPENSLAIPDAFKVLRVYDLKPIRYTKIPWELFQLIHLRYMAMSFHSSIIPSAFSKLWNLETLIVDTSACKLEVKADIWKMLRLRHLKTNVSTTLPKPTGYGRGGENLLTLGAISAESCTEEIFDKACTVKELTVRGRLALLLEGENGCSFDSIAKLYKLEKLKLLNDVFPCSPLEGRLHGLPPPYKFPCRLRSLTLSATFLDWKHMSTIAILENVQVLKVKDNAFVGRLWKATDGGFRHLEVLHIEFTDLAVWEASGHHFPRLRCLELHNCESLLELPIGLADIPSLEVVDLYRTTSSAAASAKKIEEAKQRDRGGVDEFKLSIFPPDE